MITNTMPRKRPVYESLTINGISSLDYGLRLAYTPDLDKKAKRNFISYPIPGRNGNLTVDGGRYENVDIEYTLNCAAGYGPAVADFIDLVNSMEGYMVFHDSFHPDEYVEAKANGEAEAESNAFYNRGIVKIPVTRKPQRFLYDGQTPREVVAGHAVRFANPTNQPALPLIEVVMSAETAMITWGLGAITLTENPNQKIIIDSELREIYTASGTDYFSKCSFSATMTKNGRFPVFAAGETAVSCNGISEMRIFPRWWRL